MHPQPFVLGIHPLPYQQNPNITRHGNHHQITNVLTTHQKNPNSQIAPAPFNQTRYYPDTVNNGSAYQTFPDNFEVLLTPISTPPPIPRSIPNVKKRLLFIRHAEAYHNSLYKSGLKNNALLVRDPQLTPDGHNQVLKLQLFDIHIFS